MKHILFYLFLVFSIVVYSQEKLALVIGNSSYNNGDVLENPVRDVHLLSFTLEDLGFEVRALTDASQSNMKKAIADFLKLISADDVSFFYYAGAGQAYDGINYLLPVDSKIKRSADIKKEGIDAGRIISELGERSTRVSTIILDLSDDEAFLSMTPPPGVIIAYTAFLETSSSEESKSNGLYAKILTRQMMINQPVENLIINTRLLVRHASKEKQQPKEWSKVNGAFSITGGTPPEIKSTGSILLTSKIAGTLSLNGMEISTVEARSIVPLDNVQTGTYTLKIEGDNSWEEEDLVLGSQITSVNAIPAPKNILPVAAAVSVSDASITSPASAQLYVDPRDENQYPWEEFGSQIWMTRNMAFEMPGGSYSKNDDSGNSDTYGCLYTWEAAQNVCPEGWHLPSDKEWMTLEMTIGLKEGAAKRIGLRGKTEGNILKDKSLGLWTSLEESTSTNGFNALPGGSHLSRGKSVEQGKSAIYWTSTEYKGKTAIYRKIEDSKGGIHRYYTDIHKGHTVRCVKD